MPTYDYRCQKCEHEFEAFQSITAAPLKKCPKCRKPSLRRLIGTGAALLFKGDGFYITDYRSESYKDAAKADSAGASAKPADGKPADKPADGTPATTAEAQPAAKQDARPKDAQPKAHKSEKRSKKQ